MLTTDLEISLLFVNVFWSILSETHAERDWHSKQLKKNDGQDANLQFVMAGVQANNFYKLLEKIEDLSCLVL